MGDKIVETPAVTNVPAVAKAPVVAKTPAAAGVPVAGGSSKKWIYWAVGAAVVIAVGVVIWIII